MENTTQSRKWLLTIQNPEEIGITDEKIEEDVTGLLTTVSYAAWAWEKAKTGTVHIHLFLYSKAPIRFGTVKRVFPKAHIDKARGTVQENKDYITKTGKWVSTDKAETSVEGSFREIGSLPKEKQEKRELMTEVLGRIEAGEKTISIIREHPELGFRVKDMGLLTDLVKADHYDSALRPVSVTYVYGDSSTDKKELIYEHYPLSDVHRIVDYDRPQALFDGYSAQDVVVFEHFYSSVPIYKLLAYCDSYPLRLPARYSDRIACYTKVYIVSSIPPEEQYIDVQAGRAYHMHEEFMERLDCILYVDHGEVICRKGVIRT